jgi:hypothetical protein
VSSGTKENSPLTRIFEAKQQRRHELARLPFDKKLKIVKLLQKVARGFLKSQKAR